MDAESRGARYEADLECVKLSSSTKVSCFGVRICLKPKRLLLFLGGSLSIAFGVLFLLELAVFAFCHLFATTGSGRRRACRYVRRGMPSAPMAPASISESCIGNGVERRSVASDTRINVSRKTTKYRRQALSIDMTDIEGVVRISRDASSHRHFRCIYLNDNASVSLCSNFVSNLTFVQIKTS